MDIFITIGLVFMVWMCIDCIQRKEHFIWIVIMVVLFPVGAVIYYFAVKNKGQKRGHLFPLPSKAREVESEETMHLKELIKQHHKAYHYEKLGDVYLDQNLCNRYYDIRFIACYATDKYAVSAKLTYIYTFC